MSQRQKIFLSVTSILLFLALGWWLKGLKTFKQAATPGLSKAEQKALEQEVQPVQDEASRLLLQLDAPQFVGDSQSMQGTIVSIDEAGMLEVNVPQAQTTVIIDVQTVPVTLWIPHKNQNGQIESWQSQILTPSLIQERVGPGMDVLLETDTIKGLEKIHKVIMRGT